MKRFAYAPEGMPMGGNPSKERNKGGSAEDHRLRTDSIESASGQRGQSSKKNKGGGKGGKHEWKMEDIDAHYTKWQEELKVMEESGVKDARRKAALESRIAKADATKKLEQKKADIRDLEDKRRELIAEKATLLQKKNDIMKFRKDGSSGLENDKNQKAAFEERLALLKTKVTNGEVAPDDLIAIRDLELSLEKLGTRIADREAALALDDDWETEYTIKIDSVSLRREQTENDCQDLKSTLGEDMKSFTDNHSDVLIDLSPNEKDPSPPLQIDTKRAGDETTEFEKNLKNTGVAVGAGVGYTLAGMGKMAYSFVSEMWKTWRGHVTKPGTAFGGRSVKELIFGEKKKKK